MSFNISEKDLSMILTIPQFIEALEKIDNYIIEKEKMLKDVDLKTLKEQSTNIQLYQEFIETERTLKKLEEEEEILKRDIKEQEENEILKKNFYIKMMENNFDNKIKIVENEKQYPEDKYFTVEWILPIRKEDHPQYTNGFTLYIMFDIEAKRIVKMNDAKGKILDKENINWDMFPLNDKKNRNTLMLEIYKEYGIY